MQYSLLVDLAGKTPCRSEVDQDRLSLVLAISSAALETMTLLSKREAAPEISGRSLRYR
jgi:hypothetical protein